MSVQRHASQQYGEFCFHMWVCSSIRHGSVRTLYAQLQHEQGRVSREITILWGAGSLLSREASQVTWSGVVVRSICGQEHPAGGKNSPRVYAWSAFAYSAQTWLLRVTIRASLFFPHRDIESLASGCGTDTTSLPVSRRSLERKLGAAALFWVSHVGPYAGSCC